MHFDLQEYLFLFYHHVDCRDVFIPFGGGGGKRDKRREPKKIIALPQRVEVRAPRLVDCHVCSV